jgi:hypothetical protein
MTPDPFHLGILLRYVSQVPLLLVSLTGLGLAVAFRKRYPGPCLLAGLAFSLAVLRILAAPVVTWWVFSDADPPGRLQLLSAWGLVSDLLAAGQYGLFLGAIFSGRRVAPLRRTDFPPGEEARPTRPASTAFTADPQ